MSKTLAKDILIYGLGGQGAVMGAQVFVEAAIRDGKWALVNPEYGGIRRGGAVVCCLVYDTKPIRKTYPFEEADTIFTFGQELIQRLGLKVREGGTYVLNEKDPPEKINLGVKPKKLATLDATDLSIELFGPSTIPITNTGMLGAISKATGFISLESLCDAILDRWPGKLGEKNVEFAKESYRRVQVKEY
jgi:2-oxoacid:acceptor oxidoreductase gamma subunit (pyruvate/2-ketoisovalerate family)